MDNLRLDALVADCDKMAARVDALCTRQDARPAENERVGDFYKKKASDARSPNISEAARRLYLRAASAYYEGRKAEGDKLAKQAEDAE